MILDEKPRLQQKVFSEKLKILCQSVLIGITANFICATLVFIAIHQDIQSNNLLVWYCAVFLVSLFRLILYLFYKFKPEKNIPYFELYIFSILASGMLWGICGFYLMPKDQQLDQMIITVIIAGVTSGSILSLQVSFISSVLYIASSIVPLCLWLFLQDNTYYLILGFAMLTYIVFTIISSYKGCELLDKTLWLTFELEQLTDSLSDANAHLATLNEQSSLLLNGLQQQEANAQVIRNMDELLQSCKVSSEAYLIIGNSAQALFQHLSGGLVIFDKSTQQLKTIVQWGSEQILKENFSMEDCWAIRQGHQYLVEDPEKNLICYHFETPPVGSYFCLPLMDKSGVMGMFFLCAPEKKSITSLQQQLAMTLNEVIKLSLSNIYLHELLSEQSVRDPLTLLYNRRFLDEVLPRELLRVNREAQTLCVSMIDIDFFKRFNDENGHEAGDEVLKYLGRILKEHFRGGDIAARYGGEEFVLISVNTTISKILPVLEIIREEVKAHPLYFRGQILPKITISIGVAEAPRQGNTMAEILRAADEALYSAKNNGRDQVVIFANSN